MTGVLIWAIYILLFKTGNGCFKSALRRRLKSNSQEEIATTNSSVSAGELPPTIPSTPSPGKGPYVTSFQSSYEAQRL